MSSAGGNGGVPARRAVVRWAVRMFRREWRQQILVLALITVAVATAIGGAAAAYNVVPSRNGEFGTADRKIQLRRFDPASLDADLAAIKRWTGPVEVIAHRSVPVPGSVETVDLRAQSPGGIFGGSMLARRAGRYPTAAGDLAVSDETAKLLDVRVGSTLVFDGLRRTVVGLVENPADLADEFALVAPTHLGPPELVTILARGGNDVERGLPAELQGRMESERVGETERTTGAVLVLAFSSVVMLLIGLVAAAGFVVIAQRRLRQLGMLAAIGATGRHLRLVVVANGVLVGTVAAVVGAAVGLAGWIVLAPMLEEPAGHRIATFDVPWWLVAAGMALAVVTAAAAAWWPARVVARVPITQALSARPPRPKPARRSAVAAVVLLAAGFACLATGIDSVHDKANPALVMGGVLAIVLGVLFASPLAIRAIGAGAGRLPVAARLALRDLVRHQARSGAALAAISLGLGIAVAIIIVASAAAPTMAEGNLSDHQVLIRTGDRGPDKGLTERTPADLARLQAEVERFAATLNGSSVVALDTVVDPAATERTRGQVVRPVVGLGRRVGPNTFRYAGDVYVATPQLLRRLGVDAAAIRPGTELLAAQPGEYRFFRPSKGPAVREPPVRVQTVPVPAYSSMPRILITAEGVRQRGVVPAPAGWLIDSPKAFTDAQLTAARDMAASAGLTVEDRNSEAGLLATRFGATAAGVLLALGVLAMTVGLIRGEGAHDLRTLAATGATRTTRRNLTAATAGTLALLGALLGVAGAYTALLAGYLDDLSSLAQVPVVELVVTIVAVPLLAVAAGWLLAGREPVSMTRTAFD